MKDSKLISIIAILIFLLLVIDIFRDDIKNILNIKATSVSTTISVYVDPDTPLIYIASPLNKTYYYNTSIELNFTVIDSTLDKIYYNVDNGTNITITANTTFSVSSSQSHKLTLFANDTVGNINGTSVTFSINLSKGYDFDDDEFEEGESTDFDSINKTLLQNLSNVIFHKLDRGKIKFIDSLNLSKDLNLSKFINISFNRIEIDSLNLIEFNKSAILELTNLTFSNPRIKFNDIVCPSDICVKNSYSNGVLSFNVTHFTTYSTEETPSTGRSTGGSTSSGGGSSSGGGGKVEISKDDFKINSDLIKVSLIQGETRIEFIEIENIGDKASDFTLDLEKLRDILIFPGGVSKYQFRLYPGKKQSIQLIFNIPRDYKPGIYHGKILINSESIKKAITTIVEIESEKRIFDVNVRLKNKDVVKGNALSAEIIVFNLGNSKKRIDTQVKYGIKNLDGTKIIEEDARIAVETQASFIEEILIPIELSDGLYIFYATVELGNEVGSATETFKVVSEEKEGLELRILYIYILPSAGLLILLMIILLLRNKIRNLTFHKGKKSYQAEKIIEMPEKRKFIYGKDLIRAKNKIEILNKSYKDKLISKKEYLKIKKRLLEEEQERLRKELFKKLK